MSRDPDLLVMRPKFAFVGSASMPPRFGWFRKLNASALELQLAGAADAEVLERRQVPLHLTRVDDDALWRVAEGGGRRRTERGGIERFGALGPCRAVLEVDVLDHVPRLPDRDVADAGDVVAGLDDAAETAVGGAPLRMKVAPEICHPPSRLLIRLLWSRQKGTR